MATDDRTLKAEIRLMTEYDQAIISASELQDMVSFSKRELLADLDTDDLDFYGNIQAERALFWLACIFCKVKTGEIDSPNFSIGELKVRQSTLTERHNVWFNNFWKHFTATAGGTPGGHIKANRQDRTYQFDN